MCDDAIRRPDRRRRRTHVGEGGASVSRLEELVKPDGVDRDSAMAVSEEEIAAVHELELEQFPRVANVYRTLREPNSDVLPATHVLALRICHQTRQQRLGSCNNFLLPHIQ